MSDILAKLEHVTLHFAKRKVLDDICLNIVPQQILTVIGPNGAGKSSLLKLLLGIIPPPEKGQVWRKPNLTIGYVPQKLRVNKLLPLNVERFIQLGRKPQRFSIHEICDELNIKHLLKQPFQSLSGGETQRVLLARALLGEPELLILDEPAQGVDITGQGELYELLASLKHSRQCSVLLVSHDLHLVMAATDRVLCLNQHICCSGIPEDVSQHPEYLRLFGDLSGSGLAVYTHQHDHRHDERGQILPLKHGDHIQDKCSHHG